MTFVSSRHEVRGSDIIDMPISDGLKEALVNCGFTRQQILTYTTGELASILEIDQYVASLILGQAKQEENSKIRITLFRNKD